VKDKNLLVTSIHFTPFNRYMIFKYSFAICFGSFAARSANGMIFQNKIYEKGFIKKT